VSDELTALEPAGPPITAGELVERLGLWDAQPAGGRPRVVAAMIGSADGRATVGGRAGGLGSPADRAVLRALRAPCDALLVGPGTLIAERYATLLDASHRSERQRRGRTPEPLLATISRSLDPRLADVPLLNEEDARVLVYSDADGTLEGAGPQVEVRRIAQLGTRACLENLAAADGARLVTTEGGPTLLRGLVAEGLVDDLILTVAPVLVAGEGRAVLHGPVFDPPVAMRLRAALRGEDHLFLHYALGTA
jgi:riboflavin biosynthesis pyrimidine reductase